MCDMEMHLWETQLYGCLGLNNDKTNRSDNVDRRTLKRPTTRWINECREEEFIFTIEEPSYWLSDTKWLPSNTYTHKQH